MKSKLLLLTLIFSLCIISCSKKSPSLSSVLLKCKTEKDNALMFIPYDITGKPVKVREKLFVGFDDGNPYIKNTPKGETIVVIIDSIMKEK